MIFRSLDLIVLIFLSFENLVHAYKICYGLSTIDLFIAFAYGAVTKKARVFGKMTQKECLGPCFSLDAPQ